MDQRDGRSADISNATCLGEVVFCGIWDMGVEDEAYCTTNRSKLSPTRTTYMPLGQLAVSTTR